MDDENRDVAEAPAGISLGFRLRNWFLTGLVIAGPLAITIGLTTSFITWVDDKMRPLMPVSWRPETYLPFAVPGFGLIVAVVGLTLLGFLTAGLLGRTIIRIGEALLDRMPLVRSIYKALKQVFSTLFSQSGTSFRKVGIIEYPTQGQFSIVFYSLPPPKSVTEKIPKGDYIGVFLPCAPNPTTGFFIYLLESKVTEIDMSVDAAAKLVMSAGVIVPEELAKA